jgi:hypothetical protein
LLSKTAALFTSSSSTPQHWPTFWRSQEEVQTNPKLFLGPKLSTPAEKNTKPRPPHKTETLQYQSSKTSYKTSL